MVNTNLKELPQEKHVYQRLIFERRSIPAWLILLVGLYFTGLVCFRFYEQNQMNARKQFELHVEKIVNSIPKRLQDNELILVGAAALVKVETDVSRQQWRDYVQALSLSERYPGIQGVGFSEMIPSSQLASHIEAVKAEGFPEYSIKPQGQRDIYSSIKYLEPFVGRNLAAFGYDMYSDPTRRAAMQRAAEENTTTISRKVTLLQETHGKKQAGFLMYVPIYHEKRPLNTLQQRWHAIKGFVFSPFRMDDLMAGIFSRDEMLVDFQIFDGASTELNALMYDSGVGHDSDQSSRYLTKQQIEMHGNKWTVKIIAQEKFQAQFSNSGVWLLLLLGSGISLSIFITMLVLMGRRESALNLANTMLEQYEHAREHYNQQLKEVFSAASEIALIATDTKGMITLFNSGAERLLGYRAEELIGKASPAVFHVAAEIEARSEELSVQFGEPIKGFDVFVATPMREGVESREWQYVNKNGEQIPVSLTVTVIRDDSGQITGFLGVALNISERKRMDQMKSEFVSTVSHELRTPLTSISGALGLVLAGRLGEVPEKAGKLLATAHRNSQRLSHLINDLLDVEKIALGKLHFDMQVLPIAPILHQAKEEVKTYAAERCVNIVLTEELCDACVSVDEQRLKQVLANLLSNAIKFSPDGATVTIDLQTSEDNVIVSVSDQGSGISEAFKHKIFQKFAQADSSDTRQRGGTGLGLAISRELVEHMNGSIDFESTEGKGSRFFFQLPLVKTAKTISSKKDTESNTSSDMSPRILVVEDDLDVASLLKIMLEGEGYQVDTCHSGLEALEILKNRHYDLISLDLRLPDISGLEVIRRLRNHADTVNIPIVVVSAQIEQGRLELNCEANNIEWLAKPIQHESLTNIVKRHLLHHELPKILHVEDDEDLHAVISAMVSGQMVLDNAPTLENARFLLKQQEYDAVLLDIGLPDGSGLELIPDIRSDQSAASIIVLTGYDLSNEQLDSVEAVMLKTKLTTEKLMDVIHSRIRSNTHGKSQ